MKRVNLYNLIKIGSNWKFNSIVLRVKRLNEYNILTKKA